MVTENVCKEVMVEECITETTRSVLLTRFYLSGFYPDPILEKIWIWMIPTRKTLDPPPRENSNTDPT